MPFNLPLKKFLIVEVDDDCPIILQADTEEELEEELWQLFKKEGYCDAKVMTRKEYLKMLRENNIDEGFIAEE